MSLVNIFAKANTSQEAPSSTSGSSSRNEILALDFQDGDKKLEAVLNDIKKEKEALGIREKFPENFNEKARILEKADF